MKSPHKENRSLLFYMLVFFAVLAISAFSLLIQYQSSNRSAVDFFEPIRLPIEDGLF